VERVEVAFWKYPVHLGRASLDFFFVHFGT
jgi:hypothetical protein